MSQKYQDFIKNYLNEKATEDQEKLVRQWFNGETKDKDAVIKAIKSFDKDNWSHVVPVEDFAKSYNNDKFTYYIKDDKGEFKKKEFKVALDNGSPDPRADLIFGDDTDSDIKQVFQQAVKLDQKSLEKHGKDNKSWNFSTASQEYERLGKILTYNSIDVIYKLGDKKNISQDDVLYGLKNAFKTEKEDYFNQLEKIDTKMLIDAVAGVKEDINKRNESTDEFIANLNEASDIDNLSIKEFFNNVYSFKKDEDKIRYMNPFIEEHKRDVETKKKTLQASFEKGRMEIIEKEKKDTEDNFTDPVTNTVEKRVGRLGHFGPMTYIKNHPDLAKAIDAIDKQKWNIFNCAAKLLIKFFKVIEHGEKKWQEFLNDKRTSQKDIITDLENKKQKDFCNDMQQISNDGEKKKNDKIYEIIQTYSSDLVKYEQDFTNAFLQLKDKPLVVEKDGKFSINQSTKDYMNNTKNNLANVKLGYQTALDELKKIDEEKPAENTEEKQEEAPQQAASYKPVYNNPMIVEGPDDDKANTETVSAVKDAADDAKKDNEKNQEQKQEKPKEEKIDWRNTKFNFNLGIDFGFGALDKGYSDGSIGKASEGMIKVAEKLTDKNQKVVSETFAKLLGLFNSKSNNARMLSYDEMITNTITAGELFDKSKLLFDTISNLTDIPEFSDVEIGNIEDLRNEFGGAVKQISNVVEIVNDPVLLAIGHEKKEDASEEVPQQLTQQVVTVNKEIQAVDDKVKEPQNALAFIKTSQEQIATITKTIEQNDKLKKVYEVISQKFENIFKYFIPKVFFFKKFVSQDMQALGQEVKAITKESLMDEIKDIVLNLNEEENKGLNYEEISKTVAEYCGNCEKLVDNAKEKKVDDFIKEYNDWANKVNELYKNLMSSEEFKQKNADDLKPLNDEKIKSDPFYILLVIYGIFQKNQNNEEKKEETNQEETQDKGTETNSGDTKAIGQDVSSKVPAKAEEKTESFSNELAEDLYKYLRG
jgi:hypothetical protein